MNKLAESIVRFNWLIILITVILTCFFAYHIGSLKINSDLLKSLPDDDPAALMYKNIGKEFGGNEMGMIALETDNVFKTSVLRHVKQITDTVKATKGIATVTSLTNIIDIRGSEWGIEIGELVDEYDLPDTPSELDSLRDRVFSKDMYRGAIVSEDTTTTLIIFTTADGADKQAIAREIKKKVSALSLPEKLYFAGLPMMMNDVSDMIKTDIIRLIPVVFIVIASILFLSFRSVRGVVMPLLTAGIAVIWTLGMMEVLGYEMTVISNNIPIILFAVGSAYTIHVINNINHTYIRNRKKALIQSLGYIIVPVFLAAITTMAGFLSFVFGAYLLMVKDFGIFTAMGTFFALLFSVFLVPALISAFSIYNKKKTGSGNKMPRGTKNFLTGKVLTPILKLLFRHPKIILTTWGTLLLIATGGIFLIHRSVNMQDYFKKNNPTRIAEDIMQKKFGGSQPVFVVFEGDMQSPAVLKMMIKTEKYMKEYPDISFTQSVADLIEEMNDIMGEGMKIPDQKDKIQDLWFLLDGQDIMEQLVSYDLDKGIIQSRFSSYDSKDMKKFVGYMNRFINENASDTCRIQLTGLPPVYVKMDQSLFESQMSSLAIALVLVLFIVGLILRSLIKGLYATVPIIATIAILFGFMGYTHISLDVATVLVASVALGIGIDYSIHVITHFNHALKIHENANQALEDTILMSGNAIVINVFSVAGGFLVLLFSQMVPLQNFGLLVALSMVGSGLGALTLLPVILILADRGKKVKQR